MKSPKKPTPIHAKEVQTHYKWTGWPKCIDMQVLIQEKIIFPRPDPKADNHIMSIPMMATKIANMDP